MAFRIDTLKDIIGNVIYPRTKTKAITDDNGVLLDDLVASMTTFGDVTDGTPNYINADTLGDKLPSDYIRRDGSSARMTEALKTQGGQNAGATKARMQLDMENVYIFSAKDLKLATIVCNAYNDGNGWFYKTDGPATQVQIQSSDPTNPMGQYYAATGVAGAAINWIKRTNFDSNENLLLNWDFTNPINQKRITTQNTSGYTLDRWYLHSYNNTCTLTVGTGKITLTDTATDTYNGLKQLIENPSKLAGKTITFSLRGKKLAGSCRVAVYTDNVFAGAYYAGLTTGADELIQFNYVVPASLTSLSFNIQVFGAAPSAELYSAKLEIGSTASLLNDTPMDFESQLRKCQRYNTRLDYPLTNGYKIIAHGTCISTTQARIFIPLPTVMRVWPQLATVGTFYIQRAGASAVAVTSFTLEDASLGNMAVLTITVASGLVAGDGCYLQAGTDGWKINFDAEL